MAKLNDIYSRLCEIAPLELQMDFDNAGIQIGRMNADVTKALLALDITDAVIDEAIDLGAQLIISHHPMLFHPEKSIRDDRLVPAKLLKLAENRIAAISMHTNLDIAPDGVNDVLINLLGASAIEALDDGCGRVGSLPEEMSMKDFLLRCKAVLHTDGLRYCDSGRPVKKLAVMGGAGGDSLMQAFEKGCDTYVTADIKYHQFLDAAELGINLIDGDHFGTENPVILHLAQKLRREMPDVEFLVSSRHRQVISFM